jgi:penicillin amidase
MDITQQWKSIKIGSSYVELRRIKGGVVEIKADNLYDLQKGLGYAHAVDRLMQMLVTRVVGRGELTKYFLDNEEGYAIDLLVRKLGFRRDVVQDLHHITPEALRWTESYCMGVNAYLEHEGFPFLCKIFKIKSDPWDVTDTMLIVKTLSYLGIAQQQERVERLIIHAIRDGVSPDILKRVFSLEGLDDSLVALIKKLQVSLPYFDNRMRFQPFANTMSNNWALAPDKTLSGAPFLCVDPHLQVNRLPSSWYELVGHWGEGNYQMGITLPGFPGWIMGRSADLSASFTYGMFDTIDFFIEEIRRGEYRRGDRWIPLNVREEKVYRKSKGEVSLYFFESDSGVIERRNPKSSMIRDGFYLSLAWSSFRLGPSPILNCLMHLWSAKSIDDAQMFLWAMTLPCNWVISDSSGNIALQQSGCIPKRKKSGLLPLPAWDEENLWQGFYKGTDLLHQINPSEGFVASANDTKIIPGGISLNTMDLPSYRYRRLAQILSQEKRFSIEEMQALQNDCYSPQAEEYMKQIKHWIPETKAGHILKEWNLCYEKESQGATLFEVFYKNLHKEVFGPYFGHEVWETYGPGHAFFGFNFGNFDRILLSDDPFWFGREGKEELYRRILKKTLHSFERRSIPSWGERNVFFMNYLLFDGKLPKFFGFDIGPIQLNGSRATIDTFQTYWEGRRKIVTSASYRMSLDMKEPAIYSALAGGVSEKKRSVLYTSDIFLWKLGKNKKLSFNKELGEFNQE